MPNDEIAIDKQIAASALTHDLMLVTHNTDDSIGTGDTILNPFD